MKCVPTSKTCYNKANEGAPEGFVDLKNKNMMQYTETTDKQYVQDIVKGAPAAAKAWFDFDESISGISSVIPDKYKELMSIAVALTTQCPYCLERHTEKAKKNGATREEIAETIMIAAALRSGAALGYGLLTMKLFSGENA